MRDLELFVNRGIYHVYNRGVDKRQIFLDDADRVRFLNGLILFNDHGRRKDFSIKSIANVRPSENPCVEVIAYCLMPNHYHFMLKQIVDGGVAEFMHRLGTGYTKYFNERYERSGGLFEGPYKARRVETTGYVQHLSRYIHLNPLELDAIWNTGQRTWAEAIAALKAYRWSSFRHFADLEKSKFLKKDNVMRLFKDAEEYLQFLRGFVASDRSAKDELVADIERDQLPTLSVGSW